MRRRVYDRWVAEGKLSWTDAHDRMERLLTALTILIQSEEQQTPVAEPEPIRIATRLTASEVEEVLAQQRGNEQLTTQQEGLDTVRATA